ncbi:MAG: YceI family protein [Chitinophagaceae bacterium]|nr:YceI family protein [Chitinophagaceae bacterium]
MKNNSLAIMLLALFTLGIFAFKTKKQQYIVDPSKSSLVWIGKKATGEHTGNIAIEKGAFQFEDARLKSGSFDIDTRTITDNDITDKDNNAKLVGHLKSDDFFSAETYPRASLVITNVTPAGGGNYTIKANLTIKGITNEIGFPALVSLSGKQLNATAKITIDRTKYNIKFRSKSFFENLGDKFIYDNFDLVVSLVATAQ